MSSPTPVWFITAASSGFGKQTALEALRRGHIVVATARNASRIQDLADAGAHTLSFDVTSPLETIRAVADAVFAAHGRVDYLINAAGYILEGSVEEASPEEVYAQFNTNVFGAVNTLKAFLPYMRKQPMGANGHRATVATFGSVGSWHGGASFAFYSMTKWCCSALAESLAPELSPFAIRATVVEPGYFRTGFLNDGAINSTVERIDAYEADDTPTGQTRRVLKQVNNHQPGDVLKGAKAIVDVLLSTGLAKGRELPVRIVLGSDCEQTIRDKCAQTVSYLDEWQDLARGTDYPKGQ